jgi:hypothetical protein
MARPEKPTAARLDEAPRITKRKKAVSTTSVTTTAQNP